MSSEVVVDVVGVSKRFRLYHEKVSSIKERVLRAGMNPYEDFWALSDVSFQIAEGETVGVVGRNGSGKSTLLKCLAGILQPTSGKVLVRGQVAALLELGAGFQPELSGRENIFLNGSLLGLSTKEVSRRFDEIVAFAELEHFIDNQVKFYSSGMVVRLGFAIAVNVEPDVFLVDEVLAVGDEDFQRKCLARIRQFQDDGRTILFVTHAPKLVTDICDRALVLTEGRLLGMGTATEAIDLYHRHLDSMAAASATGEPTGPADTALASSGILDITAIDVEHPGSGTRPHALPGEPLTLHVGYCAMQDLSDVVLEVEVVDQDGGLIHATDTADGNGSLGLSKGTGWVDLTFDSVPLLDGAYVVRVRPVMAGGHTWEAPASEAGFEVANPGKSRGRVALDLRVEVRARSLS